jgi:hypothetical protein
VQIEGGESARGRVEREGVAECAPRITRDAQRVEHGEQERDRWHLAEEAFGQPRDGVQRDVAFTDEGGLETVREHELTMALEQGDEPCVHLDACGEDEASTGKREVQGVEDGAGEGAAVDDARGGIEDPVVAEGEQRRRRTR